MRNVIIALIILVTTAIALDSRMSGSFSETGDAVFMDVHGAGAQRSDPKSGDPSDYPKGHGPQGDVIRIYNFVRPVRGSSSKGNDYTVVDTAQKDCFDNAGKITPPEKGNDFYGQDAQHKGIEPSYTDNGNGTVTDNNTGLIWQQDPGKKMTYSEAVNAVKTFNLAGYSDWRLPTIKELYSLSDFNGVDPSREEKGKIPFINTKYFSFTYGDEKDGDRIIDSQFATSTIYTSITMGRHKTMFGVNFADGRIKGYPVDNTGPGKMKNYYVLYVRGNLKYGKNRFVENGDTVTDKATGLMWAKNDSGRGMNWKDALAWVQKLNSDKYLGYSDWRLPDAKELQSIVDYGRSPKYTNSAAIDPVFKCTRIKNEAGNDDYPFYWTSTTHISSNGIGASGVYLSFGEASGFFSPGGEGALKKRNNRKTAPR